MLFFCEVINIYLEEIKFALFALVLMITAIYDTKTKTIPIVFPAFIVCIGLIKTDIIISVVGMVTIGLFFGVVTVLSKGKIGGGDFKLMTAIGFYFGMMDSIDVALIGMILTLIVGLTKSWLTKEKLKNISLPLAPGICVGGIFVGLFNLL